MSRLIDADDFKKFLQALCKAGAPYEEVVQLLDKQPTAYDVEKVVDTIRNDCYSMGFDESQTEIIIDEVKRGGVE